MTADQRADQCVADYPLAVRFAAEVLQDRYVWGEPPHRGWRATRPEWKPVSDKQVIVLAAEWLLGEYRAFRAGNPDAPASEVRQWERQLSGRHIRWVVWLAKAIMVAGEDELLDLYSVSGHAAT